MRGLSLLAIIVFSSFEARAARPAVAIPTGLVSLRNVPIPTPSDLRAYVRDENAAIVLGKTLFWDMQLGSDGITACASCHFHAGADSRSKNQVRPVGGSFAHGGAPNHDLQPGDFPFRNLTDLDDAFSPVISDTPNRVASQGVTLHSFIDIVPGQAVDLGTVVADPVQNVGGVNTRRPASNNTPTAIDAVFQFRQLVVSASQDIFNGVNQWGERDPNQRVFREINGQLTAIAVQIDNASLASQATDPPVSNTEMSHAGRTWPKIGKKMLSLRPLALQRVHPNDSVLGVHKQRNGRGLAVDYADLIEQAFEPAWWQNDSIITYGPTGTPQISPHPGRPLTTNEFTQMEANFSLFFALAIQLYESTLISTETQFDLMLDGAATFTYEQEQGYRIFFGFPDAYGRTAQCFTCHGGPELTNNSVANVLNARVERIIMLDGLESLIDVGNRNIGVRRVTDLPGLATVLPGNLGPISLVRYAQKGGDIHFQLNPPISPTERTSAVEAAYKIPTLRNVELTGPYFHSGGYATLRQLVDFYNRGGDFETENFESKDPTIQPLNLNEQEKCWLVEFLRTLTDPRVLFERAPFDHPQLFIVDGHMGDEHGVIDDGSGRAVDLLREIPGVGAGGGAPLTTFLSVDPHDPLPQAPAPGTWLTPRVCP